eukprot:jgi/Undpi1/11191/HiC_scaffold_30.g13489.m1
MNVKTWSEAGPAGGCDVRGLDVVECWNDGRRAALRVLQAHDDFADVTQDTFDHLEAKRVAMFFPFGPDSDMPGMRSGGDTGGGDEEDLDRGASSSDAGDGESDDAEIREALETESVGENSGPPRHSKFVQIGAKKGQNPGEDANGDGDLHTSRADLEFSLGNVKGEIAFPDGEKSSASRTSEERQDGRDVRSTSSPTPSSRPATPTSRPKSPTSRPSDVSTTADNEATAAARAKQEAHNDRIVATFNSVMLADGLKVLKHHRRSSKRAASRVIRYVPDYGGALVWDKPLRQPGAKASRVPLDAISQVELEQRIVWISAGDERVGFETSKTEDADLIVSRWVGLPGVGCSVGEEGGGREINDVLVMPE